MTDRGSTRSTRPKASLGGTEDEQLVLIGLAVLGVVFALSRVGTWWGDLLVRAGQRHLVVTDGVLLPLGAGFGLDGQRVAVAAAVVIAVGALLWWWARSARARRAAVTGGAS